MSKYKIKTPKGEILAECGERSSFMGIPVWEINGHAYSHILIKELGLTVEPIEEPVKKLRAVREIASGEIKFYDNTLRFVKSDNGPQLRELAPDYDIEYPKGDV
jgi:hypothetical protein